MASRRTRILWHDSQASFDNVIPDLTISKRPPDRFFSSYQQDFHPTPFFQEWFWANAFKTFFFYGFGAESISQHFGRLA